jgi:hypothetical protein
MQRNSEKTKEFSLHDRKPKLNSLLPRCTCPPVFWQSSKIIRRYIIKAYFVVLKKKLMLINQMQTL